MLVLDSNRSPLFQKLISHLNITEFNIILYQSIALWTLYPKSFESNSIRVTVRPQTWAETWAQDGARLDGLQRSVATFISGNRIKVFQFRPENKTQEPSGSFIQYAALLLLEAEEMHRIPDYSADMELRHGWHSGDRQSPTAGRFLSAPEIDNIRQSSGCFVLLFFFFLFGPLPLRASNLIWFIGRFIAFSFQTRQVDSFIFVF